jgi:hypothetical protein
MKQRTYSYILLPVLMLVLAGNFQSCKKFLEEKQVTSLTQDLYNNESGLNSLISGLYIYARVKHEWAENGARLIEPETDAYMHVDVDFARMVSSRYGTDVSSITANVNNFLGAANSNYAPMGAYPHINNCNIALDVIENVRPGRFGEDETYRLQKKAEVLFLRSWAYYLISNQLGDVPLLLTPRREDNGIYYFPKEKLENVYKQIIADMRFAYEHLPEESDRGRVTKWAAGHFLAKLYLNRAQAAGFEGSSKPHLKMLYKGNVATDLDSVIHIATEVINAKGGPGGLAPDYWTLFNPAVSETNPHPEVLWSAQFDVNTAYSGRFGGNRSCNYHTGNYTDQTGVNRSMAYGRPFATFKPTDWAYDNFRDKVHDSRYYKTFEAEYIHNGGTSYRWNDDAAAWWNANNPPGEPDVVKDAQGNWPPRSAPGKRALVFLENQKDEALDSAMVMSQPYQFMVRWIRSAVTGKYYYRLWIDNTPMGLATNRRNIYLSSKKYVDPMRGGSSSEANFNSESGTRDAILMRLAETFLIRAEAYGRKGQYALAVNDINVVRQRAAYKAGESRPTVLVEFEPQAGSLTPDELQPPYNADGSSVNKMTITEAIFTPGTTESQAEGYIPTVTTKEDMFIHFIYNEKAREFLSEGIAWEDLHNAGILYERVIYNNQMASPLQNRWPKSDDDAGVNGQDGNGKGQMMEHYTFRPWPNAWLVQLTDEKGNVLDENARKAYQNFGY